MNEQILKALDWRYATKAFDANKKINDKDFNVLKESLRLAPSSYGLQPWKFIIVENSQVRAQLREFSWNQTQVTDASHYIVFTALKTMDESYVQKYIEDIAKTRNLPIEGLKGFKDMMVANIVNGGQKQDLSAWAQRQSYIAMGELVLAAALLGIDTCCLEGLSPTDYDRILGLENSQYATIAAVAVGYRAADDKYQDLKKVRFSEEDVFQTI